MNGDAITGPDAARRQSACKAFGFRREPLVSPHLFVKDERRTLRPSLRLVRQSTRQNPFSLAGLPLPICGTQTGRAALPHDFSLGKTVAIVGRANKHMAKTGRSASFCAGLSLLGFSSRSGDWVGGPILTLWLAR